MNVNYSIGLMIKKINTIFETKSNKELVDLHLTKTQLEILVFIDIQNRKEIEVNQVNIENEFYLKNPTVTGILNRLEEKGFIERVASEKNARCKKILITEKALNVLKSGRKKAQNIENKVYEYLEKEEKEQLEKLLNKVFLAISEGED